MGDAAETALKKKYEQLKAKREAKQQGAGDSAGGRGAGSAVATPGTSLSGISIFRLHGVCGESRPRREAALLPVERCRQQRNAPGTDCQVLAIVTLYSTCNRALTF